ncbi:heat shock protein 67B1-like [Plodia interpunctella]|uniref:heat shock protein 67B1-like n=1 Tax=Plodia interpunctella TaxID=58824 RepID=UPI002367BEA9|nr:heat shock protein 67B1-like [Plodia interpunctella]
MALARNHLLDQKFGICITPEDLILPYYPSIGSNYYRPWKWCIDSGIRDFGSVIDDQEDKFKIILDVQHFRPNEISVKVMGKEIIVEGNHEERQDNHGIISRQFKRRYVLPSDSLPELVSSTLSSDGLLTVIASKKAVKNKDIEITVPIQMCGPAPKREQVENKTSKDSNMMKEEDVINNNLELKNNASASSNIECLRADMTESTKMSTEKMLIEARKESDNVLKMASNTVEIDAVTALGKLENVKDQSKVSMDELIEKVSEKNVMNMIETSNFNSMVKATVTSEEVSSFKSSVMSSRKVSDEQISEFVGDVISIELKDAAENV